jgi:DNA-binding response OmpR family regulator
MNFIPQLIPPKQQAPHNPQTTNSHPKQNILSCIMPIHSSSLSDNPITHRVLLVEDDTEVSTILSAYLRSEDFGVSTESRGDRAVARVLQEKPDLVLLDIMLPGKNGLAVCKELRAANVRTPIVMLTAKEDSIDEILGLELGADEYITKPAEPRVLLARLRAILRRTSAGNIAHTPSEVLQFMQLRIENASRSVSYDGDDIPVSAADFDLLWFLACNAGRVMSRDEILSALRGLQYDGVSRSVDTRVSRLRKRLAEACGNDNIIKTVRPRGYMFCAPGSETL